MQSNPRRASFCGKNPVVQVEKEEVQLLGILHQKKVAKGRQNLIPQVRQRFPYVDDQSPMTQVCVYCIGCTGGLQ